LRGGLKLTIAVLSLSQGSATKGSESEVTSGGG